MSNSKSILSSTIYVTLLTFVIKVFGLIKQAVIASYCGATDETDAFFIAFGILMSLSTMIFSAISISLLTVHTNVLIGKGREYANDLINSVLRLWLPISFLITLLFFFFSDFLAKCFAPSYEGAQIILLSHYIKLMSCVFVLSCYYLSVNVILETDKEFVPGRCQGLFQNVFLIIATILFFGNYGMDALIFAFLLSGLAECLLVTWCARNRFRVMLGKLKTPKFQISHLFKLSVPLILGNAIYEINDIVDKQISSGLGKGCVSFLTYGSTINEIVTGVIVGSVSVVLFSHFATWVAKGEIKKLEENLNIGMVFLVLVILPIMSLCLFAGDDIIRLFYGRGNFMENDIAKTNSVVVGYAFGFIFSAIRVNLVKVFYAFQDTKTPFYNSVISVLFNVAFSITLSRLIGVGGVALATSLAMLLSSAMLLNSLKKHIPHYDFKKNGEEMIKGIIAFAIITITLYEMHGFLQFYENISRLILEIFLTFGLYFLCLFVLRSKYLILIKQIRNHN